MGRDRNFRPPPAVPALARADAAAPARLRRRTAHSSGTRATPLLERLRPWGKLGDPPPIPGRGRWSRTGAGTRPVAPGGGEAAARPLRAGGGSGAEPPPGTHRLARKLPPSFGGAAGGSGRAPPRRAPAPWERLSERPPRPAPTSGEAATVIKPEQERRGGGLSPHSSRGAGRGRAGGERSGAERSGGTDGAKEGRSEQGGGRRAALPHTPPRAPCLGGGGSTGVGAARLPQPAPCLPCRGAGYSAAIAADSSSSFTAAAAGRGEGLRAARGTVPGAGAARRGSGIAAARPEPRPCRHLGCAAGLRLDGDGGCWNNAHPGRTGGSTAPAPAPRCGRSPACDGYRGRALGSWPSLKQGLSRAGSRVCVQDRHDVRVKEVSACHGRGCQVEGMAPSAARCVAVHAQG